MVELGIFKTSITRLYIDERDVKNKVEGGGSASGGCFMPCFILQRSGPIDIYLKGMQHGEFCNLKVQKWWSS